MLIDRRALIVGAGSLGIALATARADARSRAIRTYASEEERIASNLVEMEQRSGGRLGAALLDCRTGVLYGHRLDERFTMCSTFKLSLAACILARMDAGEIAVDAMLPISKDDPVGHSPTLRAALDKGAASLSVLALAEAAQTVSDNGASNVLLRHIGGPAALTAFWRTLSDDVTRLDRFEPELNTSHGDDPRDTTSAAAMARTMRAILTGPLLKPASRDRLIGWTIATQTGLERIRAGLPAEWRAGDKTGTNPGDGSYAGKYNDLAIVWTPGRAEPFIITAFLELPRLGDEAAAEANSILRNIGSLAKTWIWAAG